MIAAATPSAPASTITVADLALGYGGPLVLRHLDWLIQPGSLTAIIGPNGSGKSTLLKGLIGELRPIEGSIDFGGLTQRDIAYLPQATNIDRGFPITVSDFVAMGLWRKVGAFAGIGRHWSHVKAEALAAVGLADHARAPISRLSGGQMQRVLFARVILEDAPVILLDEPFAAVDHETTTDLASVIGRWHGEGRTIIAALHDLDQVRRIFPEVLKLGGGQAVVGPTTQMLSVTDLQAATEDHRAGSAEEAVA